MTIHYKETQYGFDYGGLSITRCCSDDKQGWVYISLKTDKKRVDVYVTKTGKMRFFDGNSKEMYLRYEA